MVIKYTILTLRSTQLRLIRTRQSLRTANVEDFAVFYGINNNQLALRRFGLSNGLIGCYISHLCMWQQYLDSNADWFVFMEDDYAAPITFKADIELYLSQAPLDYDIAVLLNYNLYGQIQDTKTINEFYNERRGVWSTALYAIRKTSLHKVCDVMGASIEGHIDMEFWKKHDESKLKVCYAINNIGGLHEGSQKSSIGLKQVVRQNSLKIKTV